MRLVTGLARPTSGSVRVLGSDVATADNAVRAQLGFLPDVPAFYDWMTAEEFMHFVGGLFGLERRLLKKRTSLLLDTAGLEGVTTRIGGYSRGMRQRLGIAQALVNAPRLLLLDEPTSALDPIGRKEVLDLIDSLRGRTTIFFSTHILGDVERVCDSVAILDRGRVVTQAPIPELKARYGRHRILIEVTGDSDALASALLARPWTIDVGREAGSLTVTVADVAAAQHELPGMVDALGVGLVRLEAGELTLEDVFVELVGKRQR
ncbi:ATP-binding cassette domain-containing protein [Leifsonia poae]|uniref:ABC transporter ATP-binding protein n=1 Tax=Leifsonia poae TaxID=110933 RepID=UPI003D678EB4